MKEDDTRQDNDAIGYFIASIIGAILWSTLLFVFHKELKQLIELF